MDGGVFPLGIVRYSPTLTLADIVLVEQRSPAITSERNSSYSLFIVYLYEWNIAVALFVRG